VALALSGSRRADIAAVRALHSHCERYNDLINVGDHARDLLAAQLANRIRNWRVIHQLESLGEAYCQARKVYDRAVRAKGCKHREDEDSCRQLAQATAEVHRAPRCLADSRLAVTKRGTTSAMRHGEAAARKREKCDVVALHRCWVETEQTHAIFDRLLAAQRVPHVLRLQRQRALVDPPPLASSDTVPNTRFLLFLFLLLLLLFRLAGRRHGCWLRLLHGLRGRRGSGA
jgi:hypothetical protein